MYKQSQIQDSKLNMSHFQIDDCFLENLANLHIYDKKINSTFLDSGFYDDNNITLEAVGDNNIISLESLLCDDTDKPCMHKFIHNKNDMFLKKLKNSEILSSLTSILSDENEFSIKVSNHTKPQKYDSKNQLKYNKNRSSLFFKALTAKVKIEKHQKLKLKQIQIMLHLHEQNSWYSVNLLVSLAKSKSF